MLSSRKELVVTGLPNCYISHIYFDGIFMRDVQLSMICVINVAAAQHTQILIYVLPLCVECVSWQKVPHNKKRNQKNVNCKVVRDVVRKFRIKKFETVAVNFHAKHNPEWHQDFGLPCLLLATDFEPIFFFFLGRKKKVMN